MSAHPASPASFPSSPANPANLEAELKFFGPGLPEFAALRGRLRGLGAEPLGRELERNEVFDDAAGRLRAAGRLLRLRLAAGRGGALWTVKVPAGGDGRLKRMLEYETEVADADAARAALGGLGFGLAFVYEKLRETWRLPGGAAGEGGVHVCLDHLPFGPCVELEGRGEEVHGAARALRLPPELASTENYHALHARWRAGQGLPPQAGFAFPEAERRALEREFISSGDGPDPA